MDFGQHRERTAKEVIDDAIKENAAGTWLLYLFAVSFVLVGLGVLIAGITKDDGVTSLLGAIASLVFWPSMSAARRTRKENIALRLLEAPLSKASTSEDAAKMLHELVATIMNDKKGDGK
ncbi:hypothetical protein [Neptuniibacter sp.]|uniref:hypothetical protein n=1 Tax=Neptuniibacter sp. TaxID=1962643 RepID=UPI003B59D24C